MNPFILLKNRLYFITLRQKNKRQEGFERENITESRVVGDTGLEPVTPSL